MSYPITPAIRILRAENVDFEPHLFEYIEKGGTSHSAEALAVDEHKVIKTIVFETSDKKPLIVLMHGDRQVSLKNLARHLNVKSVEPISEQIAGKLTGYVFGGTSPFGLKTQMPIYVERSILDLEIIYINGGKRGFLIAIEPQVLEEVLKVEKVELGLSKSDPGTKQSR